MNRVIPSLLILLSITAGPATLQAAPRGAVLASSDLLPAERTGLLRQIDAARRTRPSEFATLAALRDGLPALERRQRGRLITLVPALRALGPAALLPMLAELAVEARPRGTLSDRAWHGWRVSLLEAVGSLRDARSEPVLRSILTLPPGQVDPPVLRAASAALGRLGSDAAASTLIGLVGRRDRATRLDLLRGLGECRRTRVAHALGAMLGEATGDPPLAGQIVVALGQVGNAWAWQTPAVSGTGEGERTRLTALGALITAYPDLDRATRAAAVKALQLIGHPTTRAAIAEARRRAQGRRAEALGQLDARIAAVRLLQ